MAEVLIKEKFGHKDRHAQKEDRGMTQRECHVKTEDLSKASIHQEMPETIRRWETVMEGILPSKESMTPLTP